MDKELLKKAFNAGRTAKNYKGEWILESAIDHYSDLRFENFEEYYNSEHLTKNNMTMSTKLGVAYTRKMEGFPFQILDNPLTGKESDIPSWLKSWAFKHEYEATLCLNLFLYYSRVLKKDNPNEFQQIFKMTLRCLGDQDSAWSK